MLVMMGEHHRTGAPCHTIQLKYTWLTDTQVAVVGIIIQKVIQYFFQASPIFQQQWLNEFGMVGNSRRGKERTDKEEAT